MVFFRSRGVKFRCPYKGCERSFDKLTVVLDASVVPRESFFACPFCMSKLDVVMEGLRVVGVRAIEYPKVFDSPAKCAHFSGFLSALPSDAPLPDECLICPKVLQCNIRRK